MAVSYEWDVETLDEAPSEANRFDPDITDHHHCDSYVEALAIVDDHVNIARRGWSSPIACRIVLVRDQGNDEEGLTDRSWAYVTDGKLPERFNYGGGEDWSQVDESDHRVPQRFHREVERAAQRTPA